MWRDSMIGAFGAMVVLFSNTAFAQGTAAEAKAMLEKAVAAVKANEAVALAMFIKGEGGLGARPLSILLQKLGRKSHRQSAVCSSWHGCSDTQGRHWQGLWSGALHRGAEAGR